MEGKLFYIKCKKKRYNNENGGRKMKRLAGICMVMLLILSTTIFTWANEAGADLSKKLLNLGKIMM